MSYQNLQELFRQLNSKNIVYNKAYYKLTGSVQGAVLLSHLTYLFSEIFVGKEFYQSDAQLQQSLGFSERTLRTAKDSCKRYVTAVKRGVPAKNHWVVHEHVIIGDLLEPGHVRTSPDENVMTGRDENVSTGGDENVPTKNKENNKDLKINSSKAAAPLVDELISSSAVPPHIIAELIGAHGEEKVLGQLKNMKTRFNISNPAGWLRRAIEENYVEVPLAAPKLTPDNLSPPSYDLWSEEHQKKFNAEREKLAAKDDWRDSALKQHIAKRGGQG
jgi:hypothetical protein